MSVNSKIEWTDHTFNPWWGCVKPLVQIGGKTCVSPECVNCYAETTDKRYGGKNWGKTAPRRFFGDKHWKEPLKWNNLAKAEGVRKRVFCASMGDILEEDRADLNEHRKRLEDLVAACDWLDWQILTKRPENTGAFSAQFWQLRNIWFGISAGVQETLYLRAPIALSHKARLPHLITFLSAEPLLGAVELERGRGYLSGESHDNAPYLGVRFDWVIVGGESGSGARPMDLAWVRSIVAQCKSAGVACFVKQLGARPIEYDLTTAWKNDPVVNLGAKRAPWLQGFTRIVTAEGEWLQRNLRLKSKKGGDWDEWPEDLRLREFPYDHR